MLKQQGKIEKRDFWFYLGASVQILMWVSIFLFFFIVFTSDFDFSEFRYVGY